MSDFATKIPDFRQVLVDLENADLPSVKTALGKLVTEMEGMYSDLADAFNARVEYQTTAGQPTPADGQFLVWKKSSPAAGEPPLKLLYNDNGAIQQWPEPASAVLQGIVELATDAETQTGTDAARAVTPAGLSARTATDARTGVVELATVAEVQAQTDTDRAVTPAGLGACTATDARKGVVEMATDTEAGAGTDTERYINPHQLHNHGPKVKMAYLWEQQAAGTNAGNFTSGDEAGKWGRQRVLNQEYDPDGIVTLSGNQFTLAAAGTYRTRSRAPGYDCNSHKTAIFNVADAGTPVMLGASMVANGDLVQNDSWVQGEMIITASTTYELRHKCQSTRNIDGMGRACNFGHSEVYAQVWIEKVA